MKKINSILLAIAAATFSASVSAQDISDTSQLDMSQIQQLACMANDLDPSSQSSLDNIGSMLTETLALYSQQISEEQLQSATEQANEAVARLNLETSMRELCSGS